MKPILLIGPLPNQSPDSIGGATISFQLLYDFLRQQDVPLQLIVLNEAGRSPIRRLIKIVFSYLFAVPSARLVWLNVNQAGFKYLSPFFYGWAKLWGKAVVFRMFGGDILDVYRSCPSWLRWLHQRTTFKSELKLLQTKAAVNHFKQEGFNAVHWLPTSRPDNIHYQPKSSYQKKFAFIGRVTPEKGIYEIISATRELPADYTVHIYGPVNDVTLENKLIALGLYQGKIDRQAISCKLMSYDCILLPSYHPGEGYPGIIIEAYAAGIPCIATRWKAIPEIVEDGKTGLLIPPKDSTALVEAIQSITAEDYLLMSKNARKKFREFDAQIINERLLELVQNIDA